MTEIHAGQATVYGLFANQASLFPERVALADGARSVSYASLLSRVQRLALALLSRGVRRGSHIALVSENRAEVMEVNLAAAAVGVCVACQNWRLSSRELDHCIRLVRPELVITSERFAGAVSILDLQVATLTFGLQYEEALEESAEGPLREVVDAVDPEDPFLVLYTSGTTGLPKGAVISQRAEIMRNLVIRAEFGIAPADAFVAWSPLYHMGALDPALGTLMTGGRVIVVDGFDAGRLCEIVANERVGWLLLIPGMIGAFADELERRAVVPKGIKLCGVMADLVPPTELARITTLLRAPYANTFGATETGCPPCSSSLIPIGAKPERLSKEKSPFCEIKLVDSEDREVARGEAGQLCIRGPTVFSGYFDAHEANREAFLGGWFHMGDVFVQNPDGTLDFVDRKKYLIKSGGENIYPAELERVLLQDPRVIDVAVVRQPDARWGEVPVAFVARRDETLDEAEIERMCRESLASYKRPKRVLFIEASEFPRTVSGKIQRHELEKRLD